jgi:hypothetical protein
MRKTKKLNNKKSKFTRKNYNSNEGMLTSVWGPSLWHFLHTISFNYPVNPSREDINTYRNFMKSLKYILPCKYCRINYVKNVKDLPLTCDVFKSRNSFSKYVYKLHEHINGMLGKQSNLSYNQVRFRYEHFRSRCAGKYLKKQNTQKIEKGCVDPLHGKKTKCILNIVSDKSRKKSFTSLNI